MAGLERRALVAGGATGGYPYQIVAIYRPHLNRAGKWVWKRCDSEGHRYFGTIRLLAERPGLHRGSLQWVPLTPEEMVAHDAAQDGVTL